MKTIAKSTKENCMKTIAKQFVGLFVLGVVLGICTPAHAGTVTGTLNVAAGVGTSCTVFSNLLNFGGGLVANPTANIDAGGLVIVNCTSGAPYFVDLGSGANLSGTQRRMANAGNFVAYQLYADSAHTQVWGSTCCGGQILGFNGAGSNQFINVFGRIATGAITTQPVAEYTDAVTITVTF